MGLYADITNDVAAAFNTDLADAVKEVTLTNYKASNEYDAVTGQPILVIEHQQTTRGVFSGPWDVNFNDSPLSFRDETLIILSTELDFEPVIGTEVTSYQGTTKVAEVRTDPVTAVWELRVRF